MRPARSIGEVFTFGGRVPPAVGGLLTAIVLASLVGTLARGLGIVEEVALVPALVWRGQVWRLVTWVFFHDQALSLIFAALTLYSFGRDLCYAWGPRRFLLTFLGVSIASAVVTCLIARVWPQVMARGYNGAWPPILGLIVAWAMIFPERQMLFWMALPMSGRTLLWVTLGGTLFFAAFTSLPAFVPELSAELVMVAYARGYSLRGFWQSLRIKSYERRARRRASHLKVVKKEDPPRWLN
jgi:membrane associated rhomboid family serine protease